MNDQHLANLTRAVLDSLFKQGGGPECANILVRHQVESFNEFLDKKLVQIIQGFNPIQVCHNYSLDYSDFRYKMFLNVLRPSLTKPMYQTHDGAQMLMTPHVARINNLTYACNLYVDIHIITEIINNDGVIERNENTVNGVCIGKIPIMIRSKACVLTQMPSLGETNNGTVASTDEAKKDDIVNAKQECRFDYGGYFIVNGNEKVIISQDRISENKTLVFAPNCNGDGLNAEIRSMPDLVFLPPKTTSLHMAGKPNHMGHVIRLNASFLRNEIPLFVMFRALGIESDREIYAHIVMDLNSKKNERIIAELAACAEDASDVHTQEEALMIIRSVLGTTGTPKEYLDQPSRTMDIIKNTIRNDFLSHVGPSFKKKALYVGYMVRKLISIHLGYQDYDNRDSYLHKRIDTPGILYANLFRQCYGKLIKDVRNLIVRELNLWRATPNVPMQLISANNIHRFFKQTVIESGLRYALSTGNWGVKSIGSFQNIRQGVAQVLNRMSYLSTLSHLRRISTPMEKNGKLVQPRKLENTQYGMICPAECFAPDTPILLWNGTIKYAKDIIVGDYLIDDNGNSVRVRSTCSGFKTMYEIIPTKNNFMQYTVTDNHILTLKARNHTRNPSGNKKHMFRYFDINVMKYINKSFDNKEDLEKFKSKIDDVIDITIEQYLSLPTTVQNNLYTFKSSGINWEYKEVALDPYILGMWLGDGLSSGYGFVTADKELLDKWIEWGKDNDGTIKHGHKYKYRISSTINNTQPGIACNKTERAPLKKLLEVYNLVNNKHIPKEYLVNDRKTRLAVLAGMIDTDGNVRANGHEIRICQGEPNYKIIYDAEFLARSLGFSCHLNDGTCSYTVNGEKRQRPYKELTITGEYLYEIPTVLPRKKLNKFETETSCKKCCSHMQSRFQLIKKDVEPFVGWQVEGSGRFLLGDMSIIHNTPEGAPVGLVKNMAMSTHVTNNTSSALIRDMLEELGVRLYDDRVTDTIEFLRRMGSIDSVTVMINGDLVGFHENPKDFYDHMKCLKVTGSIPPKTAIVWDILKNLIYISTEAGRLCRPVYIVDPAESTDDLVPPTLRILKTSAASAEGPISFNNLITSEDECEEILMGGGCVEFMDVDEVDKAMIAMFPADLAKSIKGTSLPPKFTHCEIHPSLMLGVLASNIPFMNHNQSPRNCYQCLWVEETVLLVSGERRRIADVKIGDNVLSFHPKTGIISISHVTAHIIRPASKPMCRVTTVSGRSIVVTTDHKFMTAQPGAACADAACADATEEVGWRDSTTFVCSRDAGGLTNATTIGIYFKPTTECGNAQYDDPVADEADEASGQAKTTEKSIVTARILGYYHGRPSLGFDSIMDEDRFNDDVKFIGFPEGYRSMPFLKFLNNFGDVEDWFASLPRKRMDVEYSFKCGLASAVTNIEMALDDEVFIYNHKRQSSYAKRREFDLHVAYMHKIGGTPMSWLQWDELVQVRGDLLMVPVYSKEFSRLVPVADITVESDNHSFIGGDGFAVSNSAMGKQAVGIYTSNFNNRTDTMAHVLHYPQRPLVQTQLSKYVNSEQLPSGINAIVAIMTYTGFNQEDSVMVNQSAIDRGLFTTTYFKSYRDQCSKNHSTGEEEVFMKPIVDNCGMAKGKPKPFNYDKLAEDGFVPKNTFVDSTDILVGKVMPNKVQGVIQYRDTSMQIKGNDDGYVDMNYTGMNGDGYKFCKVRMRKYRKPTVGDKLASKHAQKGTIGMVYREADMPFTKDGIRPDIIMNPHAVPSRMTIAQLMECIMCKTACNIGACGDSTPFNSCSVKAISDILEKSGYERYGNEILYNGRTGQQIQTEIFIGPTYYQRLKHMVSDKIHCTPAGTNVLCFNGWKNIEDVTMEDKVATLVNGEFLEYVHPNAVLKFPDFSGKMYHISNQAVDLDVTMGHRMYVSRCQTRKRVWSDYKLEKAEDIVGKMVRYKKNANWTAPEYQFVLPEHVTPKMTYEEKIVDMDAWLTFFGIWMAEGCAHNGKTIAYTIAIAVHKQRVKDALYPAVVKIGYKYNVSSNVLTINDKQLHAYMAMLSVGAANKKLPDWVWELSLEQSRKLIHGMLLGDGCFKKDTAISFYYTSSKDLANDFQRLCLHAGWASIMATHLKAGNTTTIRGKKVVSNHDVIRLSVIKSRMNPTVNHGHHKEQKVQKEYTYDYTGPVYCLQVPSEVFMVRQNGKAVWTGNSRSSNGPIVLLTRQPAEGRARYGGLRFGEMERDGIVAHGASLFLKERMLDVSDNFRVFPCKKCGLIAVANPEKNIYHCGSCKTSADICQVRLPYSMSLLLKELESMSVALRLCF
jgi:DNA-directed RNA polymerase beta subunit